MMKDGDRLLTDKVAGTVEGLRLWVNVRNSNGWAAARELSWFEEKWNGVDRFS